MTNRQLGWWHSQYMESHKINVPNHQPDSDDSHVYLFGGISHINVWALHSHLTRCENPFLGTSSLQSPQKQQSRLCILTLRCSSLVDRQQDASSSVVDHRFQVSGASAETCQNWGSHPAFRPGLKTFAPGLPTETQLASTDFHAELSGNNTVLGFSPRLSVSECLKNQHCPQAQIHQMVFSEIKVPITPLICHWLTY